MVHSFVRILTLLPGVQLPSSASRPAVSIYDSGLRCLPHVRSCRNHGREILRRRPEHPVDGRLLRVQRRQFPDRGGLPGAGEWSRLRLQPHGLVSWYRQRGRAANRDPAFDQEFDQGPPPVRLSGSSVRLGGPGGAGFPFLTHLQDHRARRRCKQWGPYCGGYSCVSPAGCRWRWRQQ
jgi:hypothetical protein